MLTKKECKNALIHIKTLRGSNFGNYYSRFTSSSLTFDEDYKIIEEMYEELFENPPLTFDEIRIGEPIFDNEYFDWIFVRRIDKWDKSMFCIHTDGYETITFFKENRFFKKEVAQ